MTNKTNPGRALELKVASAYRDIGAIKVEHDVELAGNQIDVFVELATAGNLVHSIAIEVKNWRTPVGIDAVNNFGQIVKLLHSERLVDEGVIISASGFSRPARNASQIYGIHLLTPTDLEALVDEAQSSEQPPTPSRRVAPPPAPCIVHPYPMQENFTGRIREREMLTRWLGDGQSPGEDSSPVLALVAIGGMGKSALTWAWLHRDVLDQPLPGLTADPTAAEERCHVPEDERPEGVFWWSFYETDANFPAFLDKALEYAGGPELDRKAILSDHDKVRALVKLLEERRFLIVLDGFERQLRAYASLAAAYQGDEITEDPRGNHRACTDPHAADFLRWAAALPLRSQILLTSRLLPRELDGLAGCQREDLIGLAPEDAVTFFHAQGVQGTRAEIQAACAPCGYHPLTLRLLAGMIVNDPAHPGDVSVAGDYIPVDELVPRERHILAQAYDSLDQPLRDLLSRLAAFRSPVDYDVAATLSPFKRKRELGLAFHELMNRGLIYFDEGRQRYDLHPIVRRYAYRHLVDKEGVHDRLRNLLSQVTPPDEFDVQCVEDLAPVIELYHHTVRAGRHEDALDLYRERLADPLYYRLGAYQVEIDLLHALFDGGEPSAPKWAPEIDQRGEITLPRLREKRAQAWTLNTLASSYSRSGQPRAALPLLEMHHSLRERLRDETNLAIGLRNLGSVRMELGELAEAEKNLRQSIAWSRESKEETMEASGHQELGRLLAIQGNFDEAEQSLDAALRTQEKIGRLQSAGRTWAYRSQCALLVGKPKKALDAARSALDHAQEAARSPHFLYPVRDFVWAYWLLGTSHLAMGHRLKAEVFLSEALTRSRRINLVELEPDVLLSRARWHHARDEIAQARESAEEALSIATRGDYRLKKAEIHNFLAVVAAGAGDTGAVQQHAALAKECAWCDGPPHCYQPALHASEQLLGPVEGVQ